ncbi:MAG: iron ABC transporter substrate-binding protein [Desulfobacterales bacterium]|nr:iron ABC transporter substrate-binding protein [Desulfobacterales bacterium]
MIKKTCRIALLAFLFLSFFASFTIAQPLRQIKDANLRIVNIPKKIDRIICSGPGSLRLITYFGAQDLVVAVDDIETRNNKFDARPYSLASPQFKKLPVFGGFRGHDNPEKILGLKNFPQVIFKTFATMGYDPVELEQKTGIPVVILEYGDLFKGRKKIFNALNIIGQVLQNESRAKELITFFNAHINELENRTKEITDQKTCFVGGIAFKGPHGFQSTEPSYPPFQFINAQNIASTGGKTGKNIRHSNFSKEKILQADPDILFLDLSTLQMGKGHGGLHELKNDPVYRGLTAVKTNKVYGVLPYNWYTQNFGSILADAWYIGKILYPDRFADLDPEKKADDIYEFLVSKPVFGSMNSLFQNMVFKPVDLN